MAKMAYIRVSTTDQNLDRQKDSIDRIDGIDRIFEDKSSGSTTTKRDGLKAMMEYVRQGDTVYIESISRLARNVRDLLSIVEQLNQKQVQLVSLKENIDTTTPTGTFFLQVMAAMAELERNSILERQREGIESAKSRGKHLGRPKADKPQEWDKVIGIWRKGEITATAAMKQMGMTKTTFYKLLRTEKATG